MPHPNRPHEPLRARALPRACPAAQLAMRAGDLLGDARRSCCSSATGACASSSSGWRCGSCEHAGRRTRSCGAKLTPRYAIGCKRILPTDEWYPALTQAQRRAGHGGHPRGAAALDRDRRRHGARGRHDHLRHRLPRHRHPDRRPRARARRPHAWPRSGTARRAPTRAPPWPASRTCSSSSARTPASGTTRSSS